MLRRRRELWLLAFSVLIVSPLAAQDARPLRQVIDGEIRSAWQREKIIPAPRADDAAFLRRVYLDLVGTIPTDDEAKRFLDDTDPEEARQADRPAARRPAFRRAAGRRLGPRPLRPQPGRLRGDPEARRLQEMADRASSPRTCRTTSWVRDLLLAEQDGSEMFYVQFRSQPEEATVAVSRIFLGTQLQCARCHDHPFESWTQKDFYGMAGFFVRLLVVDGTGSGKQPLPRSARRAPARCCSPARSKEQKPGQKGDPVKPKFLGGAELDEPPLPEGLQGAGPQAARRLPQAALLAQGEAGRLGDRRRQSVLRQGGGQPRLGAVHGPRHRPSGGRPRRQERADAIRRCSRR